MGNGPLCSGCALEKIGGGFTEVEIGKRYQQTKLLLVGEASGKSELADSLPFRPYGQSGSLLMDALRESSIDRGDIAITNIIRCRPLNDQLEKMWYQYGAINHCTNAYLVDVIKELKPNVILALGGTAFRTLTSPIAGKSGTLDYIRGYTIPGAGAAGGIPVIPTYHPAHLRRGAPELYPLLQRDLRRAFLMATGRLVEGAHYVIDPLSHKGRYQTAPSLSEAWEWFRNIDPERSIYADIETPRSRREDEDDRNSFADRDINLIQFTQRRGEGIALPWRDDYIEVASSVLRTRNRKVGHNWFGFDLPVLAANGITVNGEQDDTMILWKHFQPDLPANLQTVAQYCGFPFAWKHLADSEPEFYGAIDVDATCWADETLRALLEKEGRLGSYKTLFQQFWPILRDMSRRGLPVSEERRDNLREVIKVEGEKTDEAIKALIPVEVLGQKQKNGYKDPPLLKCDDCGEKFRTDHFCQQEQLDEEEQTITVNVFVAYSDLAEANGLVQREVTITEEQKCRCKKAERSGCSVCAGSGIIPQGLVELRWMALTEFNPNSSHQVKRWMKFKRYPIPKHAKRTDASGEAAETTEVKELERLAAKTKDPVFPLLIQKRQLTKISGTYVEGWAADKDGRVRSTFTFGPATLQTACCAAWTPITTKIGILPIASIQVGDEVFTHNRRWRKVTQTFIHPDQPMYEVHLDNGHILTCTILHRLLCFEHGSFEEMANVSKRGECSKESTSLGLSNQPADSGRVWNNVSHGGSDSSTTLRPRGIQQVEGAALFPLQTGREESYVGEDRKEASQLQGRGVRWARLLDVLEGRQEAVCASLCDGESFRYEEASALLGRTSYRREQDQQSVGQSGVGNAKGAWNVAGNNRPEFTRVRITKILPVGNLPVYDITVADDESYESCGVISHNSREPNVQNGLKHGKTPFQKTLAKAFNGMQCAEPGHVMVNIDAKSFHAQTTACEAGLADYLRLAKIDIHSFVTCHYMRMPERIGLYERPDEEMKEIFKKLKKDEGFKFTRDYKAKRCILGIQFSMGPKKLFMLNPDDFDSEKEARVIHELIMKELFPGLAVWQEAVKKEAQEKKFLLNKYGAIRRFHDVVRYDRNRGKWVGGDQAESAVAFLPASSAFGYMRAAMSRIREKGWDERYQLVNSIHDSLVLHCPKPLMEECIHNLTEEISKPSEVLVYPIVPSGLSVEAEASFGPDLSAMEEYKG